MLQPYRRCCLVLVQFLPAHRNSLMFSSVCMEVKMQNQMSESSSSSSSLLPLLISFIA